MTVSSALCRSARSKRPSKPWPRPSSTHFTGPLSPPHPPTPPQTPLPTTLSIRVPLPSPLSRPNQWPPTTVSRRPLPQPTILRVKMSTSEATTAGSPHSIHLQECVVPSPLTAIVSRCQGTSQTGTASRCSRLPSRSSGVASRRRDCHSAAPPSPLSRRFNMDGEWMIVK